MTEHVHTAMDRQIFNLGLSVEATSAYILITSLRSENLPPTMEHILARWTVSAEQLDQALAELLARGVINRKSAQDGQNLYFPNPSSLWRSATH